MDDTKEIAPAPEAGDEEAALWRELEQQDKGQDAPPPDEGREDAQDAPEPEQEPAAEEASAPQDETEAPAPEADAQGDPATIWANAPPELKAAFEEERRARINLEHAIRSDRGRLSAMQRKLDDLARSSPDPANRPQQGESAQGRDERLRRLAEEYPEVAQPLLEEMDALRQTVTSLQTLEQHRHQQALAYQEAALAQNHADWQQVLANNGATFQSWLEDQPKAVRDAAMANATQIVDAQSAAAVIGRFKEYLGLSAAPPQPPAPQAQAHSRPLTDRRQRQLAAAAAPRSAAGRPVASGIPEDGDPEAIWAAFEAMEARQRR